jgi:elongation factor Ts
MATSAEMVRELREKTGAGVMECKRALDESGGDMKRAEQMLEEAAGRKLEKTAGRATNQGIVDTYIHGGGRIGAMVELNCETDFVARNELFRALAHDIAMQIAAMNPKYVSKDEIPADEPGRPEELALLSQAFIKEPSKNIEALINDVRRQTGENIQLRRFTRFELGA